MPSDSWRSSGRTGTRGHANRPRLSLLKHIRQRETGSQTEILDFQKIFVKLQWYCMLTFLADMAGDPPSSGAFEEDLRQKFLSSYPTNCLTLLEKSQVHLSIVFLFYWKSSKLSFTHLGSIGIPNNFSASLIAPWQSTEGGLVRFSSIMTNFSNTQIQEFKGVFATIECRHKCEELTVE